MHSNGKTFLGVLTVAMALSAMAASAAQAIPEFKASAYPVTVSGAQIGNAVFSKGAVVCEKGAYSAFMAETSSTLKVEPEYEKCQSAGYPVTTVSTSTGCYYTLKGKEKLAANQFTGTFGFICPAGNYFLLTAFLDEKHSFVVCQVKIFYQAGPYNKITFNNIEEAGKKKVEAITKIENFTYVQEGIFCASGGFTNGSLESTVKLSAKNKAGEAINLEMVGA